jgi:SHS2 domain-containing protein
MGHAEPFDHTADLGLRIHAADLNDLFRTAAEALFELVVANRRDVRPQEVLRISVSAESVEELLVDWLNELIFQSETQHRFFGQFDVCVAPSGLSLTAEIRGETIDLDRHVLDHEVKAVTHHGVTLVRSGDGWVAEVILDI